MADRSGGEASGKAHCTPPPAVAVAAAVRGLGKSLNQPQRGERAGKRERPPRAEMTALNFYTTFFHLGVRISKQNLRPHFRQRFRQKRSNHHPWPACVEFDNNRHGICSTAGQGRARCGGRRMCSTTAEAHFVRPAPPPPPPPIGMYACSRAPRSRSSSSR